jgi:hypothetical protein
MATKAAAPGKAVPARVAPAAAKPAAASMNSKFQAAVLKLLKGDSSKMKSFQRSTDDFRSGNVSPDAFLKTLENLFGADALSSVVTPLAAELPERDLASKLKAAYDKAVAAKNKSSKPPSSPFAFFGGKKAEPKVESDPMAAIAAGATNGKK